MEEKIRNNLTSPNVWTRLLYMILFAIAYSIAEFIIICTVVFQFFTVLITGRANEPVLKFGNNLSRYVYQVFRYQTYNSEDRPFPFSDWPEESVEDNIWLRDPKADATAAPAAAPQAPAQTTEPAVDAAPASASEQNPDTTDEDGNQNRSG